MSIQDINYTELLKDIKEISEKLTESSQSYKLKVDVESPVWNTTTTSNLKKEEE